MSPCSGPTSQLVASAVSVGERNALRHLGPASYDAHLGPDAASAVDDLAKTWIAHKMNQISITYLNKKS